MSLLRSVPSGKVQPESPLSIEPKSKSNTPDSPEMNWTNDHGNATSRKKSAAWKSATYAVKRDNNVDKQLKMLSQMLTQQEELQKSAAALATKQQQQQPPFLRRGSRSKSRGGSRRSSLGGSDSHLLGTEDEDGLYFSSRPPGDEPVQVYVTFLVKDLSDVNPMTGTFYASLGMNVFWHDPRMVGWEGSVPLGKRP